MEYVAMQKGMGRSKRIFIQKNVQGDFFGGKKRKMSMDFLSPDIVWAYGL